MYSCKVFLLFAAMLQKYPSKPRRRLLMSGVKILVAAEVALFGSSYYVWYKLCNQQGLSIDLCLEWKLSCVSAQLLVLKYMLCQTSHYHLISILLLIHYCEFNVSYKWSKISCNLRTEVNSCSWKILYWNQTNLILWLDSSEIVWPIF